MWRHIEEAEAGLCPAGNDASDPIAGRDLTKVVLRVILKVDVPVLVVELELTGQMLSEAASRRGAVGSGLHQSLVLDPASSCA